MRGIHRKRFRGLIAPIDRTDLELGIELWIDDRTITVARRDKPLGTWPIGSVEFDRVGSARFVITLAEEHCAFIAQDPIAFSYEGLKAITTAKEKSTKRYSRRFNRHKYPVPSLKAILVARTQGLDKSAEPEGPPPPVDPSPPVEIPRPAHITKPRAASTRARVVELEPADPYELRVKELILEQEPDDLAESEPAFRRHPGVLARVRNARNGVVHEHVYTRNSISGGLIRRVCNECGHVSIDLNE